MDFEAEKTLSNTPALPPLLDGSPRSKTSLRMHYEAQVSVIRNQIGTLEQVRIKLDLSQRKMAQLLLIDPSSWTRWTKQGDEAPPHIWRALQWYLALNEKIPGLTPAYFIGKDPETLHIKALQRIDEESLKHLKQQNDLEKKIEILEKKRQMQMKISFAFICLSLLLSGILLVKSGL